MARLLGLDGNARRVAGESSKQMSAKRKLDWSERRKEGNLCAMKAVTIVAVSAFLVAAAVSADEPKVLGSHADWHAFTSEEKGGKVCYMASKPQKEEGDYAKRGEVYFLVTHRPAEKSVGVVSVITGYRYKEGSEVKVNIGGHKFVLFTEGNMAFAYDDDDDRALVVALKRGLSMDVQGISIRGTLTTDTYSLSGFTAAYDLIGETCGVK